VKFKIGQVEFVIEFRANKDQNWTTWHIVAPIGNDRIEIRGSYNPHVEHSKLEMELKSYKNA
jgi:hypothetical protein